MLGNIIAIEGNIVVIHLNIDLNKFQSLVNLYVVLEDENKMSVGEIIDIKESNAYINLLGELNGDKFIAGVIRKPSFGASVKLISKERIPLIIGMDKKSDNEYLYLGKSPVYENVELGVDINSFFSNHFAIFGSTGSGKSCSVSRIFQNLFLKTGSIPYRASIFIFDAYGEYHSAFKTLHELKRILQIQK